MVIYKTNCKDKEGCIHNSFGFGDRQKDGDNYYVWDTEFQLKES